VFAEEPVYRPPAGPAAAAAAAAPPSPTPPAAPAPEPMPAAGVATVRHAVPGLQLLDDLPPAGMAAGGRGGGYLEGPDAVKSRAAAQPVSTVAGRPAGSSSSGPQCRSGRVLPVHQLVLFLPPPPQLLTCACGCCLALSPPGPGRGRPLVAHVGRAPRQPRAPEPLPAECTEPPQPQRVRQLQPLPLQPAAPPEGPACCDAQGDQGGPPAPEAAKPSGASVQLMSTAGCCCGSSTASFA
jgi:hypothetical protein